MVLLNIVLNWWLKVRVWVFMICVVMLCVCVVLISFGVVFMLVICVLFRVRLKFNILLL